MTAVAAMARMVLRNMGVSPGCGARCDVHHILHFRRSPGPRGSTPCRRDAILARFADRISGPKTGLHPRFREGMLFFSWKCSISRRDPLLFNLILTADEPDDG
jgi:hypothetical protein